jgi:hypothetical protein
MTGMAVTINATSNIIQTNCIGRMVRELAVPDPPESRLARKIGCEEME